MNFFAVDLGATSGRTIIGNLSDGKIEQRELTRFKNPIIELGGHCFWDIFHLYDEIIKGLRLCADEGIEIASIGIDTWGVDFVCFGKDGMPLRNPYSYRDPYTEGIMDEYFRIIPKEKVYEKTGIQFMDFNSLFQLFAQKKQGDSAFENADKFLFMPDALAYLLTGEAVCEYTILSTSQMLNPRTKKIDKELIDVLGLDENYFGRYVQPSEKVGTLSDDVQKLTGLGPVPVIAVAGHDTASAVSAVPAEGRNFAYLSCGTWSLLGIEVDEAIINQKSFEYNFTNEGGVDGTTRFLKNICGLWLLERCRKEWKDAPEDVNQINSDAMDAEPFRCFINPDDPSFANPDSMIKAIQDFCRKTGQYVPQTYREMARCIFESLALRYRQVVEQLSEMSPFPIERLHVIGGGTYNQHLMQMTADSLGIPVVTGPVEGTAIGNIMLQARALGEGRDERRETRDESEDVSGERWEVRRIIASSIEMKTYLPSASEEWDNAYNKFNNLCL